MDPHRLGFIEVQGIKALHSPLIGQAYGAVPNGTKQPVRRQRLPLWVSVYIRKRIEKAQRSKFRLPNLKVAECGEMFPTPGDAEAHQKMVQDGKARKEAKRLFRANSAARATYKVDSRAVQLNNEQRKVQLKELKSWRSRHRWVDPNADPSTWTVPDDYGTHMWSSFGGESSWTPNQSRSASPTSFEGAGFYNDRPMIGGGRYDHMDGRDPGERKNRRPVRPGEFTPPPFVLPRKFDPIEPNLPGSTKVPPPKLSSAERKLLAAVGRKARIVRREEVRVNVQSYSLAKLAEEKGYTLCEPPPGHPPPSSLMVYVTGHDRKGKEIRGIFNAAGRFIEYVMIGNQWGARPDPPPIRRDKETGRLLEVPARNRRPPEGGYDSQGRAAPTTRLFGPAPK
jgi:hypothetical protein